MPDQPQSPPSILQSLKERQGIAPKVLLPDADSEHGASPVVDPGSPAARLVPQGRGNYQIMGEIARGGMSVILKGHDTDLGRDVAVKVLDDELARRPEIVQRFIEEAQIGGQLQHPGIVPVYELGLMGDERPYFTMKLIKGRTLASLFAARKQPSEDRGHLLAIFASVCQTVAYAHSKGVVHRDLKPANIMVGAFSEVQVVDWGLAKVLARGGVADERRAQETRASLHSVIETVRSGPGSVGSDSMVGSVMGTPAYMAPEQAQGEIEKLDERVDVFSLGAILCELLTGAPPYVESGDTHLVVQAARAQLDPARERIEACGADAALRQLCLDCLTPARAARPANADEVAKALQTYLTTSEERAHAAELAAAEARIKAAEERRARRLSIALGASITLALVAGGGGYLWVSKARAERVQQTRAAVEAAQGEAIQLLQAGQPEGALAKARNALSLARTGEVDADLVARAEQFVQQAEQDVEAARQQRAELARDAALRGALVDLRLEQVDALMSNSYRRELDAAYTAAFADYGLDLEAQDLVPALERIRARGMETDVGLALDDWARLRRQVYGRESLEAENLFFLAMDLDDDPIRLQMRQAIAERDRDALLALARPETLDELPASSIFVLASAIWDAFREDRPTVFRIFDHVTPYHPDDFVLQSVGGMIYRQIGRWDAAIACCVAALSQRPADSRARENLATGLLFAGRLVDAEAAARASLALDQDNAEAHYTLSMALLQLGRHADALDELQAAIALGDDRNKRMDELVNLALLGRGEPGALQAALRAERVAQNVGTLLFGLVVNGDRAARDPRFVLEFLDDHGDAYVDEDWVWMMRTLAHADLGEWEQAERAMASNFRVASMAFFVPPVLSFVRAEVYAHVGKQEAARECYEHGLVEAEELIRDDEAGWARSDLVRWRERAAAALGR